MKELLKKFFIYSREKGAYWGLKLFPFVGATIITALCAVTLYKFSYDRPLFKLQVVEDDLNKIVHALKEIDDNCHILSVKFEKNVVDFLTVTSFVGSQIGCLNLKYPKKWKGPYFRENPTLQAKLYEIVYAQDGVYVIPPEGATLPNGRVIGKDIIITAETALAPLLISGGDLFFDGTALARRLDFIKEELGSFIDKSKLQKLQAIDASLTEFNEALPYTYHQDGLKQVEGKQKAL